MAREEGAVDRTGSEAPHSPCLRRKSSLWFLGSGGFFSGNVYDPDGCWAYKVAACRVSNAPQPRQDRRSQNHPHRQDGGLQDSASAGLSPHLTFPSSEQGPISTGSSPRWHRQGQGQRGSRAYGSHCFVSGRRKGQCPASEEGVL